MCVCNGTGKLEYRREEANSIEFGSQLCVCRERLAPREGKAHWWGLEPVFKATVPLPIGDESVEIGVRAEVPISEDNYRVHRRGNRYYPTLIDLDVGKESLTLHAHTARELGQALINAAAASEAVDLPDLDACGHWWPCDCQQCVAEVSHV